MPTIEEFLTAILPEEGLYCLAVFDQERNVRRQEFYESIHKVAVSIARWDRENEGTHAGVYHGCASYTVSNRLKESVRSAKALWLEVDYGAEGHKRGDGYRDMSEALGALAGFCGRAELPRPLVVGSGHGLHAYWPLDRALVREQWEQYAGALKLACQRLDFRAEPQRTADISSILRPPGTWNRKGDPVQVVSGPLVGPYSRHEFDGLFSYGNTATQHRRATSLGGDYLGPRPSYLVNGNRHLYEAFGNITVPEPIDFDALASGCRHIGDFKRTDGQIPEPLWYAGLGVLGWAVGGDRIAHEWSKGHPKYTAEETDERLARVRKLTGPTTCAHFKSIDPAKCVGCAFGSSTPLEAGRRRPEPTIPAADVLPVGDAPDGPALPGHPEYQFNDGVLYWVQEATGSSKAIRSRITEFPVRLASVHVGEINEHQHYYLLQHYKPHVGWREAALKASALIGKDAITTVADLGVVVHDPLRFHAYIRDSVDVLHKRGKPQMSFEQFGWKHGNSAFLYGDKIYTSNRKPIATAISPELRFRSQWLRPAPGGSVNEWKNAIDCLMGKGSEGMSFTILASFASVLMRFLEETEGGAIVNLMTRHSGAGKTTSLSGAYTVWASDVRALGLTTIDTKVSKSVSLGALANLPAIYDEFTNKDPEIIREFVVMFTSGRDKMRADSSGHIIHSSASWQMLLLAASNQSLVDTIMSTGHSDAPAMRVLEFPVESSGDMPQSQLMALAKQLAANAGWAGHAYLEYLMRPGALDWVREQLPIAMDDVMRQCAFGKEHRFWARTLAATGIAAIIVDKLGLISFSPDRVMNWAQAYFAGATTTTRFYKDGSMIPHLAEFLNSHLDETIRMPCASEGRRQFQPIGELPRRRTTVRVEVDTETAVVNEASLRQWLEVHAGGGYTALVRELKALGMLHFEHSQRSLGAGTRSASGAVWTIGFDAGAPIFSGLIREVKEEARRDRKIADMSTFRGKRL
jgi:hypothetical protein